MVVSRTNALWYGFLGAVWIMQSLASDPPGKREQALERIADINEELYTLLVPPEGSAMRMVGNRQRKDGLMKKLAREQEIFLASYGVLQDGSYNPTYVAALQAECVKETHDVRVDMLENGHTANVLPLLNLADRADVEREKMLAEKKKQEVSILAQEIKDQASCKLHRLSLKEVYARLRDFVQKSDTKLSILNFELDLYATKYKAVLEYVKKTVSGVDASVELEDFDAMIQVWRGKFSEWFVN